MAPPPPPSASYHWKMEDYDTSSDEDDEDDDNEQQPIFSNDRSIRADSSNTLASVGRIQNEEEEQQEEAAAFLSCNNSNTPHLQLQQHRTRVEERSKRKKKQKKSGGSHGVSFGSVQVHTFERCLGLTVVPGDGGWPLGLEMVPADKQSARGMEDAPAVVSVDEYETERQERLVERWRRVQDKSASASSKAGSKEHLDLVLSNPLETRQWDYRRKVKNPLFRMLTEHERMTLLLSSSTDGEAEENKSPPSSPDSPPRRRSMRTRSRSGSFSDNNGHSHRTRSGSFAENKEHYNDTYTQIDVHHVRNELEQLRNSRTMDGSVGCTCRKLHVYLLPPNAGKKAHHKRMKLPKVKQELIKRHKLPDNSDSMSRDELELLLHDLVEQEPCCTSNDCPCARSEIECQSDTCSCWYASHLTKQQQHDSSSTTVSEIAARCGNPNGMYAVDLERIDAFRRNYLATLTACAPAAVDAS